MYGLFQTVFYFGYMALGSITLGILCGMNYVNVFCMMVIMPFCVGTVGYAGTSYFVTKMYSTVKID